MKDKEYCCAQFEYALRDESDCDLTRPAIWSSRNECYCIGVVGPVNFCPFCGASVIWDEDNDKT